MGDEFIIKKLEAASVDQVSKFRLSDKDDTPLVRFIRRSALKSSQANLTQTYILKRAHEAKVLAYVSMMCAEVALENTYAIADKIGADRYDFHPALRIARLAVSTEIQGYGFGKQLMQFAIGIVQEAIQPNAGCRFLILDAKQKSIKFYEKIGFRLLDTSTNRNAKAPLMFMDLQNLT